MQFLKRVFEFYINSSIHVALAVCSLVCITIFEFDLKLNYNLLLFVFFATITGYNFVKYFGLAKFHHRELSNWLKQIQIFSLLCFISLCYFSLKLELRTLFYLIGLGVITFLYAIPFLPKSIFLDNGKNLRAISGLKIYVIALVWSGTTVIIPLVNENYVISTDVILTAIQRYIYVLVAMLPFEIRDLQFDSLKLSTIPQRIGIKLTKIIGMLLLLLFYSIEILKSEIEEKQLILLFIIVVIVALFLIFSKVNQKKYYSSFGVESIPVIWLLILILLR